MVLNILPEVIRRLETGEKLIEIDLIPKVELKRDAWGEYFCARLAWGNESSTVYRAVNETRNLVIERQFESPHFIEIDDGENRVTVLTAGLPFHRHRHHRALDR